MKTIIVWFRSDLRIHDHPALASAIAEADAVVPLFILSDNLLSGQHASSNRNRFLLESLQDLKDSLRQIGGNLVVRRGDASEILLALATDTGATAVYYTADFTSYSITRDKQVKAALSASSITFRAFPGRLIVSSLDKLHTKLGKTHKIFTPFWKNWQQIGRRELADTPIKLHLPIDLEVGALPSLSDITTDSPLSPEVLQGGETAARKQLANFLKHDLQNYHLKNNDMSLKATSRLSSYLHFGCLSPREIETMLPGGGDSSTSYGANAWHRQLAWREFYNYVIFNFPSNSHQEFQERFRNLIWADNPKLLEAWKSGQTGYPVVDAGMRQLSREGWMHNRARLIVGSFLTKDLWLNWRAGEQHFMRLLIDGDQANNNGNWQWIASVGVDPAPAFRRLYNPTLQQKNYDPTGAYVRQFVPELKNVPDKYLSEPWTMPADIQQTANCIIGTDYPAPIVNHHQARLAALEHYRSAT